MTHTFTAEQVMALAPDASSAKAGRGQASPAKWQGVGADDVAVWGLCKGSAKEPYQTQIDLFEVAFRCSCPSRKVPCKHALGLFLLYVEQPHAFVEKGQPAWVAAWLDGRRQRAAKVAASKNGSGATSDPSAAAKRATEREARITQGVDDLSLWLQDLVRQGLAVVQAQPLSFWEMAAARLVDAQAPGLARLVRDLGATAHSGNGWQEGLLTQIGRLHLLLEGYGRLEGLSPALQADLRTLVGWSHSQDDLLLQEGVRDRWVVLGHRVEEESLGGGSRSLRVQRTWLQGAATQRPALFLHFAAPGQPTETGIVAGTELDAELVFYPSAWPLRAVLKTRLAPPAPCGDMPGIPSLSQAIAAYATALSIQPWLERYPLALGSVVPYRRDEQWLLRDSEGDVLPLYPRFEQPWTLLAISGGYPIRCFGEWNGRHFLPLSAFANATWTFFG